MTGGALGVATREGRHATLTPEQLDNLALRLGGSVLGEGDEGWEDAVLIWNGMVARTPALVIQPTSADDVAAAVGFARDHGLLLSIKGGGHNIAGTSIAEGGLTLDMSRMREISVDPAARLAHVGPGSLLKDVDSATQEHGLATVLGFISEVGVAGLTLGGGLGYLTRRFGWTVDNLEEVEIVTADGEIRTAGREKNADLFWALRGGGGNFGVVTRFTFRLHDVGPNIFGGLIAWPLERADEILRAYRTITAESPPVEEQAPARDDRAVAALAAGADTSGAALPARGASEAASPDAPTDSPTRSVAALARAPRRLPDPQAEAALAATAGERSPAHAGAPGSRAPSSAPTCPTAQATEAAGRAPHRETTKPRTTSGARGGSKLSRHQPSHRSNPEPSF
jgi:FAD/FMN-containing dehydrogenase